MIWRKDSKDHSGHGNDAALVKFQKKNKDASKNCTRCHLGHILQSNLSMLCEVEIKGHRLV